MPNLLTSFASKHLGTHFIPRLKWQVMGLAEDFWKDGPENLFALGLNFRAPTEPEPSPGIHPAPSSKFASSNQDPIKNRSSAPFWHAVPGEISEKMWGAGFVTPGGAIINGMLIKPLGLTKEMSVLDLSAGLGGLMRNTAEETGAYITGLEPDAAIAERGMQLSIRAGKSKHAPITHYDPSRLVLNRSYDCIIARETFYRAPNRPILFAVLAKHTKPHAQTAFTDYVLDPEHREKPAVVAWQNMEKSARPAGLVEAAEEWAKVGFSLRVHEDLTDFYKTEIKIGLKRLKDFLALGAHPDEETAISILRRIETWELRMAAMGAGMKFYRFYGTKA